MKKIVLSAIIFTTLLFSNISGFSQEEGVRFLPQIGLNLTQLSDDKAEDSEKFRPGFEAGLWVQTKNPIFFQPGLFYGQQRFNSVTIDDFTENFEQQTDTILRDVDYRYIKLPVMFGIQVLSFRIYTGPSFTYLIDIDETSITDYDFHDFGMGLNVGAGLNISIFSFDLRYEYGISKRFKNSNATSNTITLSAGFQF